MCHGQPLVINTLTPINLHMFTVGPSIPSITDCQTAFCGNGSPMPQFLNFFLLCKQWGNKHKGVGVHLLCWGASHLD